MLTQQRPSATYSGNTFNPDTVYARWALLELNVLMEIRAPGALSARLAFQNGQLVYAEAQHLQQVLTAHAALALINQWLPRAAIRVFLLDPAAANLAFAAIAGTPVNTAPMARWSLNEQLSQLMARRLSGAFATRLPVGLPVGVGVWQFTAGHITLTQSLAQTWMTSGSVLLQWVPEPLVVLAGLPLPPTAQTVASDDAALWALFHRVTQLHLGHAAERVVTLMRAEHGHHRAAALRAVLTSEVERFAGGVAAQRFLEQALLDAFAHPDRHLAVPNVLE
jgi:hypothetical protein